MQDKKYCKKCEIFKPLSDFHNDKKTKDGKSFYCKSCRGIETRDYYVNNYSKCRLTRKEYYENNKEKINKYRRENPEVARRARAKLRKETPWLKHYAKAKQRCEDKNNNRFYCYGARGIKFLITKEEIKELWFRDKAYLMNRPSIDRSEEDGNYEFSNCQFMELSQNVIKRNKSQRKT